MLCRLLYLFYTLFCLVSGLGRSSVEQKAKWRPDIPACSHSSCSWEGRVGAALTFTTTETCICMCTPQLCVFSDKNICNQSEHVLYVGYFIIFFRRVEHHVTVHRELPQANSQHNQLNMNMNVNMRMETVSVRKQSRAYALQFTAFCCCMVSGL